MQELAGGAAKGEQRGNELPAPPHRHRARRRGRLQGLGGLQERDRLLRVRDEAHSRRADQEREAGPRAQPGDQERGGQVSQREGPAPARQRRQCAVA